MKKPNQIRRDAWPLSSLYRDCKENHIHSVLKAHTLSLRPEGTGTESLMSTPAAATYLGISRQTLEKWRSQRRGPRYLRVGAKTIRYLKSDLDTFIEAAE